MNYIICETQDCNTNATLVIVYGCLEGHLADTIICYPHYAQLIREMKYTVCGEGHRIDERTLMVCPTGKITVGAAREVLLRPKQQDQMKKRMRGLSGAWNTTGMNTRPMRNTIADSMKIKREMKNLEDKARKGKP